MFANEGYHHVLAGLQCISLPLHADPLELERVRYKLVKVMMDYIKYQRMCFDYFDGNSKKVSTAVCRDLMGMVRSIDACTMETAIRRFMFEVHVEVFKQALSNLRSVDACLPMTLLHELQL